MDAFAEAISNPWVVGAVAGAIVIILAVLFEERRKTVSVRERERTRREIAAYVAEGSMTPEDGARLLSAGKKLKPSDDAGDDA
ncbi:MAG: hypothetical protein ACF8R7_00010 [Phycisphaerales bacterium JB039]